MKSRIGLLGGTFDPIHCGHLFMGDAAADRLGLEKVLYVPANRPPHKMDAPEAGAGHRLEMVRIALEGSGSLEASDVEIRRGGISYTVDTLRELRTELGESWEIFLIIGSDSLYEIGSWKDCDQLLSMAKLAVVPRPGFAPERAKPPSGAEVVLVETNGVALDVSSSALRSLIRSGRSVRYLVPDPVISYIARNGLYVRSG